MSQPTSPINRLPGSVLSQIFRLLLRPPEAADDRYPWEEEWGWSTYEIEPEDSEPEPRDATATAKSKKSPSSDKRLRYLWLSRFPIDDRRDRRRSLVPVSQVCRSWNTVANEILYTEIYISSKFIVFAWLTIDESDPDIPWGVEDEDDEEYYIDEEEFEGRDLQSELLAETLQTSPHLGQLVRRILFGTFYHDQHTTRNEIQILKYTPFVEDIRIIGYNAHLLKDYHSALRGLKNLRTLTILRYCMADRETDCFFYNEKEVKEMIEGWKKLEQLVVPVLYGQKKAKEYCESKGIKWMRRT
jgi:hypothetical protein